MSQHDSVRCVPGKLLGMPICVFDPCTFFEFGKLIATSITFARIIHAILLRIDIHQYPPFIWDSYPPSNDFAASIIEIQLLSFVVKSNRGWQVPLLWISMFCAGWPLYSQTWLIASL